MPSPLSFRLLYQNPCSFLTTATLTHEGAKATANAAFEQVLIVKLQCIKKNLTQ
jgi:hypothetical protein